MNDIFTAPFLTEMRQTAANMYRLGWDERNGGNISLLLDEAEAQKYLDTTHILRTLPLGFDAAALVGKYFLVTGTGKYFKGVKSSSPLAVSTPSLIAMRRTPCCRRISMI